MDEVLLVDVDQSIHGLGEVLVDELLVESLSPHELEQIPVLRVLEDEVDLVFLYEVVVELYDVYMRQSAVLNRLLNHAFPLIVSQAFELDLLESLLPLSSQRALHS